MDKKIMDLIISLRIGEKRIRRLIRNSKKEEREIYEEMIKSLMDGDKDTAREYAKNIIKIRKHRTALQKYWSKIRDLRVDMEKAAVAKELKSSMVEAAKRIAKITEKMEELDIWEATRMLTSSREYLDNVVETIPEMDVTDTEKEEIEEILKIAETEGIEKIKEMFPSVDEVEEEKEILSEEE